MSSYNTVPRGSVDSGRLWAGGFATAIVAALVAVVGILIARGLLDISVLAPEGQGAWGSANTVTYALGAAVVALLATLLMHVLMLTTPTPTRFFGWIMALLTLVSVVMPLGLFANLDERLATAAINFVIGVVIASLIVGVASSARRPPAAPTHLRGAVTG